MNAGFDFPDIPSPPRSIPGTASEAGSTGRNHNQPQVLPPQMSGQSQGPSHPASSLGLNPSPLASSEFYHDLDPSLDPPHQYGQHPQFRYPAGTPQLFRNVPYLNSNTPHGASTPEYPLQHHLNHSTTSPHHHPATPSQPHPIPYSIPSTSQDPAAVEHLSSTFVDLIGNVFKFGETEKDLRQTLHGFVRLGRGLSKPDLATRTYILAANLEILRQRRADAEQNKTLRAMISDLYIRLEDTFSLSNEQKTNILIVGGDLLVDPNRIVFSKLAQDMDVKLRSEAKELRLTNVYGNLARERITVSYIKRCASSLRNGFRELLRDSVIGNNTMTLEECVFKVATRFQRPGQRDLGVTATARIAILRRFALETPELLNMAEDTRPNADDDIIVAPGLSTPSSPDGTPGDTTIGLPSVDGSLSTPASSTITGKRKRSKGRGKDFWSHVEMWFGARRIEWGQSWGTRQWKDYIKDTINKDHARFKVVQQINPYMLDPVVGSPTVTEINMFSPNPLDGLGVELGGMSDLLNAL